MISEETIKTLYLANLILELFYCQSWMFSLKKSPILSPNNFSINLYFIKITVWKIPMLISYAVTTIAYILILPTLYWNQSEAKDIALGLLLCIILFIVTITFHFILTNTSDLMLLFNSVFLFDKKLEIKFFQPTIVKDVTSLLGKLFILSTCLPGLLAPIGTYNILGKKFSFLAVIHLIMDTVPFGRFLAAIFASFIGIYGYYQSMILVTWIILYCNFVLNWLSFKIMRLTMLKQRISNEEREEMRLSYYGFQMLHGIVNQVFYSFLPLQLVTLCILTVGCAFCVIRYKSLIALPMVILMLVITTVGVLIIIVCVQLAFNVTSKAQDFKNEFKKYAVVGKGDFRYLKASQPFVFNLGGIYKIHSYTVLVIINNILVSALINLLVSVKP